MILTNEIIENGKSYNNGYSKQQLELLGITGNNKKKGWKKTIIGNEYPQNIIEKYLSLKNQHIPNYEKYSKDYSKDYSIPVTPPQSGIAVDASCRQYSIIEYRGFDLASKSFIFASNVITDATNNIGEYLAIVHALAYANNKNIQTTIYSDSMTALAWIRNKRCNTKKIITNNILENLIQRANKWIQSNSFPKPIFWSNKLWGEIPADYNRK